MKIIDRLKDKGKLKIYNMAREAYLKKAICDIGRILKKKIVSYVMSIKKHLIDIKSQYIGFILTV